MLEWVGVNMKTENGAQRLASGRATKQQSEFTDLTPFTPVGPDTARNSGVPALPQE